MKPSGRSLGDWHRGLARMVSVSIFATCTATEAPDPKLSPNRCSIWTRSLLERAPAGTTTEPRLGKANTATTYTRYSDGQSGGHGLCPRCK